MVLTELVIFYDKFTQILKQVCARMLLLLCVRLGVWCRWSRSNACMAMSLWPT